MLDVAGDMEDDWEVDDWAGERSDEEYANFFGMTAEQLKEYRESQGMDEEQAKLQERLAWEMKVHGQPSQRTIDRLASVQGVEMKEPDAKELLEKWGDTGNNQNPFIDVEINETWIVQVGAFGGSSSETIDMMMNEEEVTPEVKRKWWQGTNLFSAGVIMGRWLSMQPPPTPIAGKTVVELGCGVGLPGTIAALVGAKAVLFTDYIQQGLQEAMKTAVQNGVAEVATGLRSNWTDLPERLDNAEEEHLHKFRTPDLIIGADILFEPEETTQVAEVLAKMLKTPDQLAQIIDPYKRSNKRLFMRECKRLGLDVKQVEVCTWEPEGGAQAENDENWFCDLFTVSRPA